MSDARDDDDADAAAAADPDLVALDAALQEAADRIGEHVSAALDQGLARAPRDLVAFVWTTPSAAARANMARESWHTTPAGALVAVVPRRDLPRLAGRDPDDGGPSSAVDAQFFAELCKPVADAALLAVVVRAGEAQGLVLVPVAVTRGEAPAEQGFPRGIGDA